jgi:sugar phosphate isomerase/epimerase
MNAHAVQFSVFTKPWHMPLPDLAVFVKSLGFEGIELPVRPGYPVTPENVAKELPKAVKIFHDCGLSIFSIAGPTDEATLAACAEQCIPIIRVMVPIGEDGYQASIERTWREYDHLLPLLERYGVKVGVQNHNGRMVCHALGLRHLLEKYDPTCIGAVWDAAHNALNGEEPEMGLDIIWPHLLMINLKNALYCRQDDHENASREWKIYWTSGDQGLASWPRVAGELNRRGYSGVICLTAEYSDEQAVDRLIAADIRYARSLF